MTPQWKKTISTPRYRDEFHPSRVTGLNPFSDPYRYTSRGARIDQFFSIPILPSSLGTVRARLVCYPRSNETRIDCRTANENATAFPPRRKLHISFAVDGRRSSVVNMPSLLGNISRKWKNSLRKGALRTSPRAFCEPSAFGLQLPAAVHNGTIEIRNSIRGNVTITRLSLQILGARARRRFSAFFIPVSVFLFIISWLLLCIL